MTRDNWLTIAAIITAIMMAVATLMAPSLAEVIKFRLNQPTATPAINIVSSRITNRGKRIFWVGVSIVALSVVALILEAVSSAPLTRWGVIRISLWFFFIAFSYVSIAVAQVVGLMAVMADTLNLARERLNMLEDETTKE